MNEEEIAARFEDTVWFTETPIPDVNGTGRIAVGELAHSHGKKVILTGEDMITAIHPECLVNVTRRGIRRTFRRLP
jgi:hypothetical protein